MTALDELLQRLQGTPLEAKEELQKEYEKHRQVWMPNPGAQFEAYHHKADVLLYGGQGGGGKALALDTPIPTLAGWTTMGEIQVGDVVFDERGNPCIVVAATPVMAGRPCFRITFSDGATIVADAEHQWWTKTDKERFQCLTRTEAWRAARRAKRPSRAKANPKRTWTIAHLVKSNQERSHNYKAAPEGAARTTLEIALTLEVGKKRAKNHSIDVAAPLQCPDAPLLIDPYMLGLWLGDGSSYKAEITTADAEIVQAVAASGYEIKPRSTRYAFGVNGGLWVALKQYGLVANKHIPPVYLRASREQRLALLQGLMDTDGYCDKRGQCEFSVTKKKLADDVAELITGLGIKVAMVVGDAKLNGRVISKQYSLKFLTDLQAFRLPRKLIRQKRGGFRGTHSRRYIVAADAIESVPVRCIQVDSPSRLYLAGRQMIPTHNSDLGLGLAFTAHERSLIMRRHYANLSGLTERAIAINGSRSGFNGSPPPLLRTADGRYIQFGANQHLGDEQAWQGIPFDFKYFDEATQFLELQVRFHLGWLRTTTEGQRTRAVLGTNPPVSADGDWIIGMFRPWLDVTHPKPAKPGELRWYVTAEDGTDLEVPYEDLTRDERGRHIHKEMKNARGKPLQALSRSFIPASLEDNPYLVNTDYGAKLDNLPEPIRSAVRDGNFMAARRDADFQVIPTQWIIEAQARWKPDGHKDYTMTAMAYDPAGGGRDSAELCWRHGGWYAEFVSEAGPETADGSRSVGFIVRHRREAAPVVVDVGGGYGGQVTMRLKDNGIVAVPFNGAGQAMGRSADAAQLRFANKRAEAWWRFREALNPDQQGGSAISLPPDTELRADLATPTYEISARGILIESKEEIRKRLGRSPGKGDACVMCLSEGNAAVKRATRTSADRPKFANVGYANMKRRR